MIRFAPPLPLPRLPPEELNVKHQIRWYHENLNLPHTQNHLRGVFSAVPEKQLLMLLWAKHTYHTQRPWNLVCPSRRNIQYTTSTAGPHPFFFPLLAKNWAATRVPQRKRPLERRFRKTSWTLLQHTPVHYNMYVPVSIHIMVGLYVSRPGIPQHAFTTTRQPQTPPTTGRGSTTPPANILYSLRQHCAPTLPFTRARGAPYPNPLLRSTMTACRLGFTLNAS